MKLHDRIFIVSILLISTLTWSQEGNEKKILGCWILKSMEFDSKEDYDEETVQQSLNSVVCFEAGGKFTTTLTNNAGVVTGSYEVADNGTTLIQKHDDDMFNQGDDSAEIRKLDKTHLVLKHEMGTMLFVRK